MENTLPNIAKVKEIAEKQQKCESGLLDKNQVVGVAIGGKIKNGTEDEDTQVLSVLVSQKLPKDMLSSDDLVPSKIDGVHTDVVEVGDMFAGDHPSYAPDLEEQDTEEEAPTTQLLRRRVRPVMGGYSCGHRQVTAGTIATCCYDLTPFPSIPRRYYILSNNHVLANSNNARVGDPILQPGRADGGSFPRDVVARLSRFVPIRFHSGNSKPCNYVDAAIAEGNFENLSREIYWSGYVRRLFVKPKVGDIVLKTGRTTNFTTGRVTNINATVDVNFGNGRVARFCRQIITSNMSAGGDSGSLVMDREEGAVGLLFAGSATRTIVNNIGFVQSLLRVRLTEI